MYKYILAIFLSLTMLSANAAVKGGVQKNESLKNYNQIIDAQTGKGISGAKITAPALKFITITDEDGRFDLNAKVNAPTILSVQKEGYKPFSLTIDRTANAPLIIGIEKSAAKDIVVETDMIHLGDNSYSINSANASDFAAKAIGAFYSKDFNIPALNKGETVFLTIGSIIGIDTLMARNAGQSKVHTTYASPPAVYCNGNKICEININGDNQQIPLPVGVIKPGQKNTVTIKAGKNLFQTAYIDYDDIEFTNISVEVK